MNTLFSDRSIGEDISSTASLTRNEILKTDIGVNSTLEEIVEDYKIHTIGIELAGQNLEEGRLLIPVSGPVGLFHSRPSNSPIDTPKGELKDGKIIIEYDASDTPARISSYLQENVDLIKEFVRLANLDIEGYNRELPVVVEASLKAREVIESAKKAKKKAFEEIVLPS